MKIHIITCLEKLGVFCLLRGPKINVHSPTGIWQWPQVGSWAHAQREIFFWSKHIVVNKYLSINKPQQMGTRLGLGRTKPFLLRFNLRAFGVTWDLKKFGNFCENIETWWPHFKFKKKFLRHLFQIIILENLS